MSKRTVSELARIRKWAIRGLALLLVVLVAVAIMIQVQQRLFRHRAERLLADVRSLELRKATYDDARRVYERWESEAVGECGPSRCEFEVSLQSAGTLMNAFGKIQQTSDGAAAAMMRSYMTLGGRLASVRARVKSRNGNVWEKSYGVAMQSSWSGLTVLASSATAPQLWKFYDLSPAHPNYQLHGRKQFKNLSDAAARFTPYVAPEDANRFMQFDLSCLTRILNRCETSAELMPEVWTAMERERHEEASAGVGACAIDPKWRGRDFEHVMVGKVVDVGNGKAAFQLHYALKHAEFLERTTKITLYFAPESGISKYLKPGATVIVFFDQWGAPYAPFEVNLDDCGALLLDDKNLAAVISGVAEDYTATDFDPEMFPHLPNPPPRPASPIQ